MNNIWLKIIILSLIYIDVYATSLQQELQRHWQQPLATQGEPPSDLTSLETSLEPKDCATCHPTQFKDWSQSLHSHAMGAGMIGQLVDMQAHATKQHQACIRCHAPLQEQAVSLVNSLLGNSSTNLHQQGVICAACHIREYKWYGPHKNGQPTANDMQKLPHNGWQSTPIFKDAQFCSVCHQFKPEEYSLNGKLLENTYEEWKASRYATENKTCQDCHMPDRRHLWRGIHDPDMVKQGVEIKNTDFKQLYNIITAKLTIKNTGTGHYFPTYVTPKVIIEGYQEDKNEKLLPETKQQYIISRKVAMNLSKELADTRLAPDEKVTFDYNAKRHPEATSFILNVQVEPDAFYTKFYQITLKNGSAKKGKKLLQEALEQSQQSNFSIYFRKQSLR
ncbi:multiheme c-type cytochrome [Candidatus Halobeggiatoa sp. HSG11]|nr:multiheme c-type cytochrome [Candidatus Halobeggiatoa sp. HSG11]